MGSKRSRVLGAILLNPTTGVGKPTMKHLRLAQALLGADDLQIANLFPLASSNMHGVSTMGRDELTWLLARPAIDSLIGSSDDLLLGWGIARLTGAADGHFRQQISWVRTRLSGIEVPIWALGGEPRHPSRWHQYVSDVHGRTSGGDLPSRIRESLVRASEEAF